VGIAVDQQHAIVGVDKDAVRVVDLPRTPGIDEIAFRAKNDDRRPGPLKRINPAGAVDRELADMAERHAVPRARHCIAMRAQHYAQLIGRDLRVHDHSPSGYGATV
jgi:hypothetical protein